MFTLNLRSSYDLCWWSCKLNSPAATFMMTSGLSPFSLILFFLHHHHLFLLPPTQTHAGTHGSPFIKTQCKINSKLKSQRERNNRPTVAYIPGRKDNYSYSESTRRRKSSKWQGERWTIRAGLGTDNFSTTGSVLFLYNLLCLKRKKKNLSTFIRYLSAWFCLLDNCLYSSIYFKIGQNLFMAQNTKQKRAVWKASLLSPWDERPWFPSWEQALWQAPSPAHAPRGSSDLGILQSGEKLQKKRRKLWVCQKPGSQAHQATVYPGVPQTAWTGEPVVAHPGHSILRKTGSLVGGGL